MTDTARRRDGDEVPAKPASGTRPACRPSIVMNALVVDDDEDVRASVACLLRELAHSVTEATDGAEAMALLETIVFDIAIVDVRLPNIDGITLFRHLHRESPSTTVILMTGYATIPDAVATVREGACDYVTKPFDSAALIRPIERVAERLALRRELERAREETLSRPVGETIIGSTLVMAKLASRLDVLAESDAPVIVTGESGSGKELVARTLHNRSARRDGPFVAINCAAFPETLLEAELFGHERGAFTGAVKKRDGRFKAASGGTLLLDEVGEMPLSAQIRLLRVLQEGTIEPLGSDRAVPVDVRVIAATHRNLKELIVQEKFREDLFFA